jgi:guanylate kinase
MTSSRRGLLLVISSPSGAGKTSLARRLVTDEPDLTLSISATTRAPRQGEVDGREYHFTSAEAFDAMVAAGAFLEWAEVHEHRYGTPRAAVEALLAEGRDVLFDIDWQGAEQIRAAAPDDIVGVFILPPSMKVLASRLKGRASDALDVIERRLGRAKGEIGHWEAYDYVIVNEDFDRAYADLVHIYRAERLRRARNPWIGGVVEGLAGEAL